MARCRASDEGRKAADRNGAVYKAAKTVSNPVTQVANPGICAEGLQIAGYERGAVAANRAIRTAKRRARTHYRQMRDSRTGREAERAFADPYTHAEREDEIARVLEVIEGLSSDEQEVITRHYLHEEPCARIAKRLGITENNTKQRLLRARSKLREQLRTEGK